MKVKECTAVSSSLIPPLKCTGSASNLSIKSSESILIGVVYLLAAVDAPPLPVTHCFDACDCDVGLMSDPFLKPNSSANFFQLPELGRKHRKLL